tara:strand:- start:106 stop:225 length:120 start_codon:yes stop_codon:yes gene_type:complete
LISPIYKIIKKEREEKNKIELEQVLGVEKAIEDFENTFK